MQRIRTLLVATAALIAFVQGAFAAERRLALVIGESAYSAKPLATAANDAGLVAQTLQAAGFDVTGARDLEEAALKQAFRDFLDKAAQAGPEAVAFIYFSGYGLQLEGENYLAPVDATLSSDADIPMRALRVSDVLQPLAASGAKLSVVVLDVARANPYQLSGQPIAGGLALYEPGGRALLAYNAAPGTIAPDETGDYGAYAHALAEMMRDGGRPLMDVFENTRMRVSDMTKGAQIPWNSQGVNTDFLFFQRDANAPLRAEDVARLAKPISALGPEEGFSAAIRRDTMQAYQDYVATYPAAPYAKRARAILAARREALTWRRSRVVNTPNAYWTYLRRYPKGPHAWDARRRLAELRYDLQPPAQFEMINYDYPPPPPDELVYVEQQVVYFGDPAWAFAPPPPPPVYLLPPPPPDFVILPPPVVIAQPYALPAPQYVPIPAWQRPPDYIAPPPDNVIYANVHNSVAVDPEANNVIVRDPRGGMLSSSALTAVGVGAAAAIGAALPTFIAKGKAAAPAGVARPIGAPGSAPIAPAGAPLAPTPGVATPVPAPTGTSPQTAPPAPPAGPAATPAIAPALQPMPPASVKPGTLAPAQATGVPAPAQAPSAAAPKDHALPTPTGVPPIGGQPSGVTAGPSSGAPSAAQGKNHAPAPQGAGTLPAPSAAAPAAPDRAPSGAGGSKDHALPTPTGVPPIGAQPSGVTAAPPAAPAVAPPARLGKDRAPAAQSGAGTPHAPSGAGASGDHALPSPGGVPPVGAGAASGVAPVEKPTSPARRAPLGGAGATSGHDLPKPVDSGQPSSTTPQSATPALSVAPSQRGADRNHAPPTGGGEGLPLEKGAPQPPAPARGEGPARVAPGKEPVGRPGPSPLSAPEREPAPRAIAPTQSRNPGSQGLDGGHAPAPHRAFERARDPMSGDPMGGPMRGAPSQMRPANGPPPGMSEPRTERAPARARELEPQGMAPPMREPGRAEPQPHVRSGQPGSVAPPQMREAAPPGARAPLGAMQGPAPQAGSAMTRPAAPSPRPRRPNEGGPGPHGSPEGPKGHPPGF
jgi:uncharacterized caspase-like protein